MKMSLKTHNPSEAIIRRVQNNIMSFTVNRIQHPVIIMRDFKNMKMSLKTRMKIWLKRLNNCFSNWVI